MQENCNIQQVGIVNAGVQNSFCRVTTKNDKYFAYSAFLAVYIIDQETFKVVNIISSPDVTVSAVALCNKNPEIIAISYNDNTVKVIHFMKNALICSAETFEPLVSLCWATNQNIVTGCTKTFDHIYYINIDESGRIVHNHGNFPNLRTSTCFDDGIGPIFIGGNDVGSILRYNFFSQATSSIEYDSKVLAVDMDPTGNGICVIIWKSGIWRLYDVTTELTFIHQNANSINEYGGGCFLNEPPGHFVTGDGNTGMLRLWSSASTQPIENISVHTAGFIAVNRLNNNRLLCGFADGMISVYDFTSRKFIWKTNAAHRNTIFRLDFIPSNPDLFMSCGAEGAICTWDVNKLKLIDRVMPQKSLGNIFAMAISPGGGFVFAGYRDGTLAAYSNRTMSLLFSSKFFTSSILFIDVSIHDPNLLLACSSFGKVVLFKVTTREVVFSLSSPGAQWSYSGCAFSPHEPNMFVVGRSDGVLEIYKNQSLSRKVDIGQGIFSVTWSPHDKNVFAVSTNQGGSYIVQLKDENHLTTLIYKHSGASRIVVFHPTFKSIVASGGYDGKVALFNYEKNLGLGYIQAHISHTYGIAFSPKNPFLLLTSSCDTTIKAWTIDRLFIDNSIQNVFKSDDVCYRPANGVDEVLKIAQRISKTGGQLRFSPTDTIHIKDLTRITEKLVKKMTVAPSDGPRIKQAIKNKERLIQAAEYELKMGNIKRYCEFMFTAGEHAKAAAAAPAVSVKFWQAMLKACADTANKPNEFVAFTLAQGDVDSVIDYLEKEGDDNGSLIVACASKEGSFHYKSAQLQTNFVEETGIPYEPDFNDPRRLFEYSIASKKGKEELERGNVFLAAADYLSIGDTISAIDILLRCGEIIVASKINILLGYPYPEVNERILMLAPTEELAIKMFKEVPEKSRYKVAHSFKFENEISRSKFYNEIGLPSLEELKCKTPVNDVEKIHQLFMIGDNVKGLELSLKLLKEEFLKDEINIILCRDIISELEIPILSNLSEKETRSIVLFAAMVTAYESVPRSLRRVYDRALRIINNCVSSLPTEDELNELRPAIDRVSSLGSLMYEKPSISFAAVGMDIINMLPLGVQFDPSLKYGPILKLDDNISEISAIEMLEWNSLSKFSPLGNLARYILYWTSDYKLLSL